jgi:hypothetical protein
MGHRPQKGRTSLISSHMNVHSVCAFVHRATSREEYVVCRGTVRGTFLSLFFYLEGGGPLSGALPGPTLWLSWGNSFFYSFFIFLFLSRLRASGYLSGPSGAFLGPLLGKTIFFSFFPFFLLLSSFFFLPFSFFFFLSSFFFLPFSSFFWDPLGPSTAPSGALPGPPGPLQDPLGPRAP